MEVPENQIPEERVLSLIEVISKILNDFDDFISIVDIPLMQEPFIEEKDLCLHLKLDKRTLARYRSESRIPFYKINGRILFKASEIDDILKQSYFPAFHYDK